MDTKNKNKLGSLFVLIILMGGFFIYSPVIFQEGNPCPQIRGMVELGIGHKDIVEISVNKYMTRSANGSEEIKIFMKEKGYDFKEQMGSGYVFESLEGRSAVVVHKYYSRFYSIWSISVNR